MVDGTAAGCAEWPWRDETARGTATAIPATTRMVTAIVSRCLPRTDGSSRSSPFIRAPPPCQRRRPVSRCLSVEHCARQFCRAGGQTSRGAARPTSETTSTNRPGWPTYEHGSYCRVVKAAQLSRFLGLAPAPATVHCGRLSFLKERAGQVGYCDPLVFLLCSPLVCGAPECYLLPDVLARVSCRGEVLEDHHARGGGTVRRRRDRRGAGHAHRVGPGQHVLDAARLRGGRTRVRGAQVRRTASPPLSGGGRVRTPRRALI